MFSFRRRVYQQTILEKQAIKVKLSSLIREFLFVNKTISAYRPQQASSLVKVFQLSAHSLVTCKLGYHNKA